MKTSGTVNFYKVGIAKNIDKTVKYS